MVSRQRPVYFQHLRKTAGTSLADTLKLFFQPETVVAAEDQFNDALSITDAFEALQRHDLVMGHSEILSAAPSNAFKVSVFRRPFDRLLSERRQWMQAGTENLAAAPAAVAAATSLLQQRSIIEILDSVFEHPVMIPSFWNHQTMVLGAWPLIRAQSRLQRSSSYKLSGLHEHFSSSSAFRAWLIDNKARISARARQALNTLDYVGIAEDFDVSAQEIFARIGLPEPGEVVVRNARAAFDDEADPRLADAAKEFLELDDEIYQAAVERHAVFRRIARGTPVDYTARSLRAEEPLIVSSREAPGGHGWHPAHQRADGTWSRWSGPGSESRFALAAAPGSYRMVMELYGAASEQMLREMTIQVESQDISFEVGVGASGLWTVVALLERDRHDRFDVVFRFPDNGAEFGLELKHISFTPLAKPDPIREERPPKPASFDSEPALVRAATDFERAKQDVFSLDPRRSSELEVAQRCQELAACCLRFFGLPAGDRMWLQQGACKTADDVFVLFADLVEACLANTDVRPEEGALLRSESLEHGRYALARMASVAVPPLFAPVAQLPGSFERGTEAFNVMLIEAASNLANLLDRMAKRGTVHSARQS